jgi:hypothetical protein
VRWRGRDYSLVQPEVLPAAPATSAFSRFQLAGMQRFGITQVMRLHHRT